MARSSKRSTVIRSTVIQGAAAGALAGFAAAWAMNLAAKLYARATLPHYDNAEVAEIRLRERELLCIERSDPTGEGSDRFAERFLHRRLTDRELDVSRDVVHYLAGTTLGAGYGAMAVRFPKVTRGHGLLFAAILLVAGEEIANPVLGLLPPPTQVPLSAHLAMLASHTIYGLTLESTRRATLSALSKTSWPLLAKSA